MRLRMLWARIFCPLVQANALPGTIEKGNFLKQGELKIVDIAVVITTSSRPPNLDHLFRTIK